MKKETLVFVCYYFPPETNVGVRRVLFWANYFDSLGYNVVIVTTKKVGSNYISDVLSKTVTVIEYTAFSANILSIKDAVDFKNTDVKSKSSNINSLLKMFKRKYINPVLGQLFDFRIINILFFIININLGRYNKILSPIIDNNSVIISTAPPWPVHILGKYISKKFECRHFVDYRDPFSNNHMFSSLFSNFEVLIDKFICKSASAIFTVSPSWVSYYKSFQENVFLLRNGFDVDMFDFLMKPQYVGDNKNTLVLNYFGSIEHPARIPYKLLDFLRHTSLNISVDFYGSCSLIQEILNSEPELLGKIELKGVLSYSETIETMKSSCINLVCESTGNSTLSHNGLIPTKVYEYIASLRPIVALVNKDSDMIDVLKKSRLLVNEEVDDTNLEALFYQIINNGVKVNPDIDYIKTLSRQNVSDSLLGIVGLKNENF
ncbi:hypothetical protein KW474_15865 [Vibrio fluvialis]|nr:hypothetical protein [Vibrio fluvialis]